ncbi:MAG: hypothetical protein GY750_02165 [Lentisphaerae bacterium]|nr:hypothetical protein [Lentisphaerota bacterium]MCP4100225.1 hypothetical protein [Lentisphaerota bacterium]
MVAGIVIVDIRTPSGFHEIFSEAFDGGLFKFDAPYDQNFSSIDPTIRVTFWSGTIGITIAFVARYGAGQIVF